MRATYTGSDKHRTHVHLSGNPAADADTRPWQSILNLGTVDMPDFTRSDTNAYEQACRTEALFYDLPATRDGVNVGKPGGINQLHVRLVGLEAKFDALTTAFTALAGAITDAGGDVDVAALMAHIDERLSILAAEQRDAVADLGEGGAAQVRADAP